MLYASVVFSLPRGEGMRCGVFCWNPDIVNREANHEKEETGW